MSPSTVALSPEEEAEALAALSVAYLDWHEASRDAAARGAATPDPPEWLPQMRCLVQAGVPKVHLMTPVFSLSCRGRAASRLLRLPGRLCSPCKWARSWSPSTTAASRLLQR